MRGGFNSEARLRNFRDRKLRNQGWIASGSARMPCRSERLRATDFFITTTCWLEYLAARRVTVSIETPSRPAATTVRAVGR